MESLVIQIIAALLVIGVHEYTRALTATLNGDPTPKQKGLLTLNPIKHIDPIGLIILVWQGIGWAKPVETNPTYYKSRKKGVVLVAMSGIIGSMIFAVICVFLLKGLIIIASNGTNEITEYLLSFLQILIYYNVAISVFNLIPLPPLAMSKMISIYSPRNYFKLLQYEKIIQVIFLFLFFIGIIPRLLNPVINGVLSLLNLI